MLNRTLILAIILLLSFSCQDKLSSNNQAVPMSESILADAASISKNINAEALSEGTFVDRTELLNFAKQYMGTTYRSASIDPNYGFDCSGFVYFVFNHFQIQVPRSSREYQHIGKSLTPEEFKVGDVLVFYGYQDHSTIGHVGIICEANGMNSKFIHSSSGKVYGVTISALDSDGYRHRFFKCIDVISLKKSTAY